MSKASGVPFPESLRGLRVAIVHYWFVGRAGGERVVEAMAEIFPDADLFVLIADTQQMIPALRGHRLTTSFLQSIPGVARFHRHTLLLQPLALEQFDLSGYDLVLSSESGPAKGVITGPRTLHVCYCHSPMRYLWDMYPTYLAPMRGPVRWIFMLTSHWLRMWDLASAGRVDRFVANSRFVASRIRKYYRRDAVVIHPPVETSAARVAEGRGGYYLCAGRLVDYKRIDLAIDACMQLGRPLRIAGDGPLLSALKKRAGEHVAFSGRVSDHELAELIEGCRALIFPGEEDFGMVPVEVMARGRPVVAYASGGALETVQGVDPGEGFRAGATGVFFQKQTVTDVAQAIEQFEGMEDCFVPQQLHDHAATFDASIFRARMTGFLNEAWMSFRGDGEEMKPEELDR